MIHLTIDTHPTDPKQLNQLKTDLQHKLNETFESLLSFFDSKSASVKLALQSMLIRSAFDRYLFRVWLFRFFENDSMCRMNLYDGLDTNELAHEETSYLSCLAKFFKNKELSEVTGKCLLNDELENLFFDKLYAKQMEKYSIFEQPTDVINFL